VYRKYLLKRPILSTRYGLLARETTKQHAVVEAKEAFQAEGQSRLFMLVHSLQSSANIVLRPSALASSMPSCSRLVA
jgi:hypothetical protein